MFCLGGLSGGGWQGGLSRGFLSGGLCPGGFAYVVFVLEPIEVCRLTAAIYIPANLFTPISV